MITRLIALAVACAALTAQGAHAADEWTGPDKRMHAQAGVAVGVASVLAGQDTATACALSAGVGAAKEVWDMAHRRAHSPSVKDFAVTALAGCFAAQGTMVAVTPGRITFTWRF